MQFDLSEHPSQKQISKRKPMEQLMETVESVFVQHYGQSPEHVIQAPGRVNLIGEHTDYNDGYVLPCGINYQTVIAASRRRDHRVRVIAVDYEHAEDEFDLKQEIVSSDQHWANYVRGVVQQLSLQGYPISGADLVISGNVPQGAGLSSSAALEVAVGQTFCTLYQLHIRPQDIAIIAQKAENEFVHCQCGIMDQLISAQAKQGHASLIDCRTLETQAVPLPEGYAIMIINSNKQRGLVDSEYNTRREQCEQAAAYFSVAKLRDVSLEQFLQVADEFDPVIAKRARHVITENARTLAAAQALQQGDMQALQRYMAESHASMRDDFEITVPEIDCLVDMVKDVIGIEGGVRMTGGGFGGCVVAIIPQRMVEHVQRVVEENYPKQSGLEASIFVCSAENGASTIR